MSELDHLYARYSALEFIVEVFSANALKDMRNAPQFLADMRDRLNKPYIPKGPIDADYLQQFGAEMKQGGEAILDKIEKRWKEISGQ